MYKENTDNGVGLMPVPLIVCRAHPFDQDGPRRVCENAISQIRKSAIHGGRKHSYSIPLALLHFYFYNNDFSFTHGSEALLCKDGVVDNKFTETVDIRARS